MPILDNNRYYADDQEIATAHEEFERAFPRMHQATAQSFTNAVKSIRDYYSTHELPKKDKRSNDYELHSPARKLMNIDPALFETSSPADKTFDEAFQQMFRKEYPEQYMTPNLLGEHLHKMEKKHIARTDGNIFLYSPKTLGDAEELQSSQRKLIDAETRRMEQMRANGTADEKELHDREKAIRLIQDINEQARRLFEQSNYEASCVYLMDNQKDALIRQTSQKTYDKFSTLAKTRYETLGYETAQNCAVMEAIGAELKKDHFSFKNVENKLKFYPQALYQQALNRYDLELNADVLASPHISVESKAVSSALTGSGLIDALSSAETGMGTKHRFGTHSDSPEMQHLKDSTAYLKTMLKDMNEKILNDPTYGENVLNCLDDTLKCANTYLAEKDKEGKALEDRSKMGQTRYKAVKALAEKLQSIREAQTWHKTEIQQTVKIAQETDPDYRNMLQQQLETKQHLYELTRKPQWTDADRQTVQQDIATLVSCQKLESERLYNGNTDGPMWTHQKRFGNLIQKVATAIKDDMPIRNAAASMDQKKLTEFLIDGDDWKLNYDHTQEWVKHSNAQKAASEPQNSHQNTRQNKAPQMGK